MAFSHWRSATITTDRRLGIDKARDGVYDCCSELTNSIHMGKTQTDKRTRLVETAMKLAYRDGFRESSLADIANAAHVPVGNVYYYFKTKEELGAPSIAGMSPCPMVRFVENLGRPGTMAPTTLPCK